jgi:hypothetical protein
VLIEAPFSQCYLVPGEISPIDSQPKFQDDFPEKITGFWEWVDPYGDCSFALKSKLIIRAANERNLHHINRSAPRLISREPIDGDFTIQTICRAFSKDQPAIGGLLVWQNENNWFCLEVGARGRGEIFFRGFANNQDLVFGRGILETTKIHLHIEKRDDRLSAYCSPDGEKWFYVGGVTLDSEASIYPALYANGHINRLIYPGAFLEGTAIQFEQFRMWEA